MSICTDTDQEERIAKLREEAAKLGYDSIPASMPPDIEEEFLRHVLQYENAAPVTLLTVLENSGYEMPPADTLTDQEIDVKLGEAVSKMAGFGAYLIHTDHLTGRQLYEYLLNDGLREEAVLFPDNAAYAYIIDLTGNGSDEDNQTYLRYYASDANRAQWALDWPTDLIPDREAPPFDRDRFLPQAPRG